MTDIKMLRRIQALKLGEELPEEFGSQWGANISALCGQAADEIEHLRAEIASLRQVAGCVEVPLKTFSDIKKELKHGS
jgi:hypothetical protein